MIKGKNFKLRKLTMKDASSIAKHANDKAIARNTLMIPHPYTLKDAKTWIASKLKEYKKKNSEDFVFTIDVNGEAVGSFGIHHIKKGHKAEIGYWLSKEHRGKGIMSEAVKLVVDYAFKKYKLVRLEAFVFPFNAASSRVLEKNGFKEEGCLKKYHKKRDKFVDTRIFSLIK